MNEQLGFYTVGTSKFESKIHALMRATLTKEPVRWNFNNEIFERANWVREPEENLDQLYIKRARQLREKYDYLVLLYSGGSDSNNVLETFIRAGLRIDEIVTNFITDATKPITNENPISTTADNHNAEWEHLTKHRMPYIHKMMPGVKISNFDMSQPILDQFKSHEDGSWILKCREWVNPMVSGRYNIIHDINLRKQFDRTKSIGIIFGVDKPPLSISDNRLYLSFTDNVVNITPISEYIKAYDNSTVEYFYWSPDSVDILRKQCWTMLNFLRLNKSMQAWWDSAVFNSSHPLNKQARTMKEKIMRNIIYTTWNDNWFQAAKGTLGWDNLNDRWFFDYFQDTPEFQAWKNGIDFMVKNISHDYFLMEEKRLRPMTSPMYFIGRLNLEP